MLRVNGGRSGRSAFGRYSLIEPIGRGGMAEVWKAKAHGARDFERVVVLKRILPHLCSDQQFVEMFIAEARLSARLNHPNIVQVFDFGELGGEYFLAMEFIEGLTLSTALERLKEQQPIPLGLTIQVVRDMCLALSYAHALTGADGTPLHIMHRDVSPSNVMLGLDGTVKLLDFGVAKAVTLADEHTRTGVLKGKISYMPPEVVDGSARADARVDLFAAGVVLHEMLTGKRLFRGRDEFQTLAQIRACEVEPPSAVRNEVPAALDQICLKALSRRPEDRYQTGAELASALAPLLHDLRWDSLKTAHLVGELARIPGPAVEALSTATPRTISQTVAQGTEAVPPPSLPSFLFKKRRRMAPIVVAVALVSTAIGASGAWLLATRTTTMKSGLLVASEPPGASIELDKRTLSETTPTAIQNLRPGQHTLRLRHAGHNDVERVVLVKAGERAMVDVALPRASHRISVNTAPSAATVFVDGTLVLGTTPTFINVTDDDFHELRIERVGYESLVYAIKPDDHQSELSLTLEPEKEARGTLSVDSNGSAQVWVDGVYTGYDTPTLQFRVSPGKHTIELRDSADNASAPTRIEIGKGESMHLTLTLVPRKP
jgi:serine/threonine protein kinase